MALPAEELYSTLATYVRIIHKRAEAFEEARTKI